MTLCRIDCGRTTNSVYGSNDLCCIVCSARGGHSVWCDRRHHRQEDPVDGLNAEDKGLQPTALQAVGSCATCRRRLYLSGITPGVSCPIPHDNGWADGRPYDCPGAALPARDVVVLNPPTLKPMGDRHGSVVPLEISVYDDETPEQLAHWLADKFQVSIAIDHERGNGGPTFVVYGAPSRVGEVIEWYGSMNPEQPPWVVAPAHSPTS